MYISEGQWEKVIFQILYVDDILLAISDLGLLNETKKFLSNSFERKDMGEAYYVIGIEILRDRQDCKVCLKAYINKVFEKFIMDRCSTSPVPIKENETNLVLCNVQRMIWNGNRWRIFLMYLLLGV